jgi:tetratricopeptide (TPR) repeat protein
MWRGLVAAGLAHESEAGWRFTHGLLVESIVRVAREASRLQQHHAVCARALQHAPLANAARIAEHWIAAGELRRALTPMMDEAVHQRRLDAHPASLRLLRHRERILDELGVSETDLLRLNNEMEVLRDALRLGEKPDRVLSQAQDILRRMQGRDAPGVVSLGWHISSICSEALSDLAEARRCAGLAITAVRGGGHDHELATTLLRGARIDFWSGDLDSGRERFAELRATASRMGDVYFEAQADVTEGFVALLGLELDVARERFQGALTRVATRGYRSLEAEAHNGIGEAARLGGDHEEALRRYATSARIYEEINQYDDVAVIRTNLALSLIQARDFDAARDLLEPAKLEFRALGYTVYELLFTLADLAIAAGTKDWDTFDRCLLALEQEGKHARLSHDNPWAISLASTFADEHGESERAARAERLADRLRAVLQVGE